MARVQWKKLAFFDRDIVDDNIDTSKGTKPTCICSKGGVLLFGDADGFITTQDSMKYRCFLGPVLGLSYHIESAEKHWVLAIGDDSGSSPANYTIKAFLMDSLSLALQSVPLQLPQPPVSSVSTGDVRYTCFSAVADASQIAVGFSNGLVLMLTGYILRDKGVVRNQILQHAILPHHLYGVSGLHFCELSANANNPNEIKTRLYVVTEARVGAFVNSPTVTTSNSKLAGGGGEDGASSAGIFVLDTSLNVNINPHGKKSLTPANRSAPVILDQFGAYPGCSSYSAETKELVVARDEGIFSYSVEDRGGAAGFEGQKLCVCCVRRYVLVSSYDEKIKRTTVAVYDLRNKFVAMSSPLPVGEKIYLTTHDAGTVYIVTSKWTLIRLKEKDFATKLESLLRKTWFPLAIILAGEENAGVSELMMIYRQYADFLYEKADFDEAMAQYCNTIGFLQPSYVIKRFLEPQQTENLIAYLEKLHERGLASADHTTLLLLSYVRSKSDSAIAQFVASSPKVTRGVSSNFGTKYFDPAAAVDILKKAGYLTQAYSIASKFRLHEECLSILLSRAPPDTDTALSYLIALVFETDIFAKELKEYLLKFGSQMLSSGCDGFVAFLIKLTVADFDALRPVGVAPQTGSNLSSGIDSIEVEDVFPLFLDEDESLFRGFLEGVYEAIRVRKNKGISVRVANTLLELLLKHLDETRDKGDESSTLASHHLEEKVMGILSSPSAAYDVGHAMLLTSIYRFSRGHQYLLDEHQLTPPPAAQVDRLIAAHDHAELLNLLHKEGKEDQELFSQILLYFLQKAIDKTDTSNDLEGDISRWDTVLEVIQWGEKEKAVPPIQVVSIASRFPEVPLYVISDYLQRTLKGLSVDIHELESSVAVAQETVTDVYERRRNDALASLQFSKRAYGAIPSIAEMRQRARDERHAARMRGGRGVGGERAKQDEDDEDDERSLDYDILALEREREAVAEQRKWDAIKSAMQYRSQDHEAFFSALEQSSDKFSVIVEQFGKIFIDTTPPQSFGNSQRPTDDFSL